MWRGDRKAGRPWGLSGVAHSHSLGYEAGSLWNTRVVRRHPPKRLVTSMPTASVSLSSARSCARCFLMSHLITTATLLGRSYCPHLTDDETEAGKSLIFPGTFRSPHSHPAHQPCAPPSLCCTCEVTWSHTCATGKPGCISSEEWGKDQGGGKHRQLELHNIWYNSVTLIYEKQTEVDTPITNVKI